MTSANAVKRMIVQEALDKGQWPRIILDGRRAGVFLPDHLIREKAVLLEIGHGMPKPVREIKLNDTGFQCELSIQGRPTFVMVPWSAVWGIAIGDTGRVWDDDKPLDVDSPKQKVRADEVTKVASIRGKRRALPAGWNVIEGGKSE